MKTVILVSDFNPMGSGYKNITIGVGSELARRGINVKVLALSDKGYEHPHPFSVIPTKVSENLDEVWGYLKNMQELEYSDVIVLSDIQIINRVVERCGDLNTRFSGVFPLEAPPLTNSLAIKLMTLTGRFVLTEFAQEALKSKHVESEFVPIPVDPNVWTKPTEEQRSEGRESLGLKKFTFLTVAENQERKNLSAAAQIIARLPDAQWILVTRTHSTVGWEIRDLLNDLCIEDRTLVIEKGMPFSALLQVMHSVDAVLQTSKAEGLGMPVLEAMACGLPVVAPAHTSFEEHLRDGRGFLFGNSYRYIDPFGNQYRYFASIGEGIAACEVAMSMKPEDIKAMQDTCSAYLAKRSWDIVGDVICHKLEL